MTVPVWGLSMSAKAPTGAVLGALHPVAPPKTYRPLQPGIRLTERQQLALALRESERLAAATEYHHDYTDSHSSDAESEDAFSRIHSRQLQTPSPAGSCPIDCEPTPWQRACADLPRLGAHSPIKSDRVDSHDSTAMSVLPANTPYTSDICSSLGEQARQERFPGTALDALCVVSVIQTGKDSDRQGDDVHQHLLNHRLCSSNSEDSTAAVVPVAVDYDGSNCGEWRPASSPRFSRSSVPSNQHSVLPCKRDPDDVCTAASPSKKRHQVKKSSAAGNAGKAADVDPEISQRRRRRQEKLGGCLAPVSRQHSVATVPSHLSPIAQQHQQQPHPLQMRQQSVRPAPHSVVLQESDPFVEAAAAQQTPLRVRIRMPCKTAPVAFRSSNPHRQKQQPSQGKPISSSKIGWLPGPWSHSRPGALRPGPPVIVATSSQPCTPAGDVASADPVALEPLKQRLDLSSQPQPRSASPSAAPQQTDDSPATPIASAVTVTAATHDSRTAVATLLPFGSPAVVRQLDASFFSSPSTDSNQSAARAVAPPADTPSDPAPAAENVTTILFPTAAPALVTSPNSAVIPSVPAAPQSQPPIELAIPQLRIERASSALAVEEPQPISPAFRTPPLQRKRLKLLPPSSEASLVSGRRSTSVGPPPPFLERLSPSDPPVVVARARRSRVNASRSSVYARVASPAAGASSLLTPCSARSSSTTRRMRSSGGSFGSSSGTLFGSASNASLLSLDDMPRQRPKSGRFKAGALEAACHRLRHLYPSASPAVTPASSIAATQSLDASWRAATPGQCGSAVGGGAEQLLAQVSQSAEQLQRRQQAEGRLLQRRMESSGRHALAAGGAVAVRSPASVAAGCAALQTRHSHFQSSLLLADAEDDGIAEQWDDLSARQALETSTMRALHDWLAGG